MGEPEEKNLIKINKNEIVLISGKINFFLKN